MPFAEGTPTTTIQLGGKSYTLGWTWGAKRRLRERIPNLTDVNAFAENLPAVLWASLDKEGRTELTIEDVEELVHPGNEVEVVEKISALFTASEPKPDPEKNGEPVAVKMPTTGNSASIRSGQSESTISV